MDETPNNRTNIISYPKETTTETRRFIYETVLDTPITRYSGK